MLYVFTGSDTAAAKAEARKRADGHEMVVVGEGGESYANAMSYLEARGLFSPKVALMIDRPLETADGKELLGHAKDMHDADALVFIIEPKLDAETKKLLPKGAKVEEFDPSTGSGQVERPNVFAFTDSFMAQDKKRSWIGYRRLLAAGISAEEIHGALLWAVRSALIASKTKSATESGLKPFVYSKSKSAAQKMGVEKVEDLSRNLVRAYHRARMGDGDLELLTESLILSK